MNQSSPLIQYFYETLGVQYIPRSQSPGSLATEPSSAAHSHIVWQKPAFQPALIFLNFDLNTRAQDEKVADLLGKIVQAIGLTLDQVWYVEAQDRSFMDFLNWLKSQELYGPLVVMKQDPDIQTQVQNAGPFDWVECFSLHSMLEKNSLKKPTWEMLKLLSTKVGFGLK